MAQVKDIYGKERGTRVRTNGYVPARNVLDELDKQNEKKQLPVYNPAKPVIRYDYFETPIKIGNANYIARFDVEVFQGANNYRTHQLVNMDLIQARSRYPAPAAGPSPAESSPQQKYIPHLLNAVNAISGTPHDYAALLVELARERGGAKTLTPEQRRELEAWNNAFPELRMSEEEFLGR